MDFACGSYEIPRLTRPPPHLVVAGRDLSGIGLKGGYAWTLSAKSNPDFGEPGYSHAGW